MFEELGVVCKNVSGLLWIELAPIVVCVLACSETCSTTAEMPSEGVAHCMLKTEFSSIYDPRIVS
jgi:hypothetical protein